MKNGETGKFTTYACSSERWLINPVAHNSGVDTSGLAIVDRQVQELVWNLPKGALVGNKRTRPHLFLYSHVDVCVTLFRVFF